MDDVSIALIFLSLVGGQLFPPRRPNISAIDSQDRVSYFSLAISHEDHLRVATFEEELGF